MKELIKDHKKRPFFVVSIIRFVINEFGIYRKCESYIYVKEESYFTNNRRPSFLRVGRVMLSLSIRLKLERYLEPLNSS